MAALLFQTDWIIHGYSTCPISGFFLISGIYQLEPLISTYLNTPLHLTKSSARDLSPLLKNIPQSSSKCLIFVITGENDSPAFKYQSKLFYEYAKKFTIHSVFLSIPEVDHFDIIERLVFDSFILTKSMNQAISSQTFSICMHEDLSVFINDGQIC